MAAPTRAYDFSNGTTADADQVDTELNALFNYLTNGVDTYLAGSVNAAALADDAVTAAKIADADKLGLSESGVVRRGKSIIATEESTTSASYTTLATPDRVSNIVLPTDGLIAVSFQAMWKESAAQAARAAIFLGSNQLVRASAGSASPVAVQAAFASGSGSQNNEYGPLVTSQQDGLVGIYTTSSGDIRTAYTGDATTGQMLGMAHSTSSYGGPVYIFAAAGTYDVSVRFLTSSGTVTAKERKLWVWSLGF